MVLIRAGLWFEFVDWHLEFALSSWWFLFMCCWKMSGGWYLVLGIDLWLPYVIVWLFVCLVVSGLCLVLLHCFLEVLGVSLELVAY